MFKSMHFVAIGSTLAILFAMASDASAQRRPTHKRYRGDKIVYFRQPGNRAQGALTSPGTSGAPQCCYARNRSILKSAHAARLPTTCLTRLFCYAKGVGAALPVPHSLVRRNRYRFRANRSMDDD